MSMMLVSFAAPILLSAGGQGVGGLLLAPLHAAALLLM